MLRSKQRHLALMLTTLLTLVAVDLSAQDRERVVVIDFRSSAALAGEASAVANALRSALGSQYTIVPSADVAAVHDASSDPHPASDVTYGYGLSRELNAPYIVTGILNRNDDVLSMTAMFIGGREQRIQRGATRQGRTSEALINFVPNIVTEFNSTVARYRQLFASRSARARQVLNQIDALRQQILDSQLQIPAGTLMMGAEDLTRYEYPMHPVSLSPYFMDPYEVTNLYYAVFLTATRPNDETLEQWINLNDRRTGIIRLNIGYVPVDGRDNYPVVNVTWYGAQAYAEWLGGQLPTEAQWEYAARYGAEKRPFQNHRQVDITMDVARANYRFDSAEPWPVGNNGNAQENPWGIYDLTGNVMEWCRDWLQPNYYEESEIQDPEGPVLRDSTDPDRVPLFTHRAIRGGAFNTMELHELRAERRWWATPDTSFFYLGFRTVRE